MAFLELVCGRCAQRLQQWPIDLDIPFEEQQLTGWIPDAHQPTVISQSPGSIRPASDGKWYRWRPGEKAAALDEGEMWTRLVFRCPNGCRTDEQVLRDRYYSAAEAVLRHLYDTRTPMLRTTVTTLLKSVPKAL